MTVRLPKCFGGRFDRLDSERPARSAVRPPGSASHGILPMKLVWSQPSAPHARPRALLPLAVLCLFLGGVVSDRPGAADGPRPVRAAAASLLLTGTLLLIVGGAAFLVQRVRRPGPRLSLAPPAPNDPSPLSSFKEEEQR